MESMPDHQKSKTEKAASSQHSATKTTQGNVIEVLGAISDEET